MGSRQCDAYRRAFRGGVDFEMNIKRMMMGRGEVVGMEKPWSQRS